MKKRSALGLGAACAMAVLGGCEEKKPPATPSGGAASAAPADPALMLDTPLMLMRDGKQSEALAALTSTKWDDPAAKFQAPVLNMSEKEFASHSLASRVDLQEQAMRFTGPARDLARAAVAKAKELAAAGNREDALKLVDSVSRFAAALSDRSKRPELIAMVGDAIQKLAEGAKKELAPGGG
jgi:hypothetical protein